MKSCSQTFQNQPKEAESKLNWRNISDEEIIATNFSTKEPEKLERVVLEVPEDSSTAQVEFAYDLSGEKRDKVRCAHCREENHYRGFVMRTEDGTRFLVGNVCGLKIYGIEFNTKLRDFEYSRDRRDYLLRRLKVKSAIPAFIMYLENTKTTPTVVAGDNLARSFHSEMKPFYDLMAQIATKENGVFTINARVRDHVAESKYKEQHPIEDYSTMTTTRKKKLRRAGVALPQSNEVHIFKNERKQIGILSGRLLFEDNRPPSDIIRQTISELDAINFSLDGINNNSQFKNIFLRLSETLAALEKEFDRQQAVTAFFQKSSLDLVISYMEETFPTAQCKYKAIPYGLVKTDNDGTIIGKSDIPLEYQPLSKIRLNTFQKSIL